MPYRINTDMAFLHNKQKLQGTKHPNSTESKIKHCKRKININSEQIHTSMMHV